MDLFTVWCFCAMTTDLRHFLQHPLTTDLHVVTLLRVMMSLVIIVPSTVVPSRSTTHMSIATSCSYYSWDFCISVVITTSSFWLNSLYWSVLSYVPFEVFCQNVSVIVKDCTHTIDFYCETLCRQTSCLLVHNMYLFVQLSFPAVIISPPHISSHCSDRDNPNDDLPISMLHVILNERYHSH